ncbi:hypothetical protein L6R50_10880 [Myxococcota bacterium]|nr:hypothetical protein [Myxococcota bacterium]
MHPERDPPVLPEPWGSARARGRESGTAAGFAAVATLPSPLAALLKEALGAPGSAGEDATAGVAADLPRLERRTSRRPADTGAATDLLLGAMRVARARAAAGEAEGAVAATRLAAGAARLLLGGAGSGPDALTLLGLPDGLAGDRARGNDDPAGEDGEAGDLRPMAAALAALGRAAAAHPGLEPAHAAASVLLGLAQAEAGAATEARATLESAVARLEGGSGGPSAPETTALRARALRALALVCERGGDPPAAQASLRRAREVARPLAAEERPPGPWRAFLVEGMVAELSLGAPLESDRLDALLTEASSLVAAAPGALQSLEVGMLLALHGIARGGIGDRRRAVEALREARPLVASWRPDSAVEGDVREVYLRGIDDALARFA